MDYEIGWVEYTHKFKGANSRKFKPRVVGEIWPRLQAIARFLYQEDCWGGCYTWYCNGEEIDQSVLKELVLLYCFEGYKSV